jgi:tripartite-type tricarboxylate transporter receptor subunit TctC
MLRFRKSFVWRLNIAALLAQAALSAAVAQPTADFYRGRTIQLIIGTGEGGGYDLSARLVAQFLPEHIPGRPVIVPRNMPGAGSIAAAEFIYSVAPRDGTVIAIVQPTFLSEKIVDKARKYEPEKFSWLGRVDQSVVMGVVWHTSPAQTVLEATHKQVVVAANGPAGTSSTIPWALNKMIGAKYKVVLGSLRNKAELQTAQTEAWD